MSGPSTPKRSPSPAVQIDEPASTRQKISPRPSPAAEDDGEAEDDGVVLDSDTSLAGLYEMGWLTAVDKEDEQYPVNELLNEKVHIWRGDITALKVDAIVNAANKSLLGGGGVDGAIHSAAGPGLYEECKTIDGAETGETKITGGYNLPAKHVLHTVGPIYSRAKVERSEAALRSCYQGCLELAVENECRTIAFSGISTGIYGYPLDDATRIALDVTRAFLDSSHGAFIDQVIFTVFRPIDASAYRDNAPIYFPPPSTASATPEAADADLIDVDVDPTSAAVPPEPLVPKTSTAEFDPPPAVAESTEVWGTAASLDEPVAVNSAEVATAVAGEPPSRTWTPVPGEGAGDGGLLKKMVMPRNGEGEGGGEEEDKAGWGEGEAIAKA